MAVITISRQLGSEGTYIARKVARALGYRLVDKRAIEDVLNGYGLVEFKSVYESVPDFWTRFDRLTIQTINLLNQVILALARHGKVVIVGRGSFAVLAGFRDVLNVRIQAPFAVRVQRVMEREGIRELERAHALVKESDTVRESFVESFYRVRWENAAAFDMVIDTGKLPADLAVIWLAQAHQALKEMKPGGAPATATIEVDPVLARAVSKMLLTLEPA